MQFVMATNNLKKRDEMERILKELGIEVLTAKQAGAEDVYKRQVAESLDDAVAIAKQFHYRFRIVTLDGQVVNAGGSLTGGSLARNSGLLSRVGEIEKLSLIHICHGGKKSPGRPCQRRHRGS